MSAGAPGAFERERRVMTERFELHADRKAAPFVQLCSGLSHGTGHIRYLMSPAEARELGEHLIALAAFAALPLPGEGR